jgi:hypothetical protein
MPRIFKAPQVHAGALAEFLLHSALGGKAIRVTLSAEATALADSLDIGISGLMASARFAFDERGATDGVLTLSSADLIHSDEAAATDAN